MYYNPMVHGSAVCSEAHRAVRHLHLIFPEERDDEK